MNWEALSAIGTLLAVVLALGLALYAEMQNAWGGRKKAGLVAARLLESVQLLREEVRYQMAVFAFYEDEQDGNQTNFGDRALTLRRLVEPISLEYIYALEPLPGNCANRLAMALGIVDALGREIEYAKSQQPWTQMSPQRRIHLTKRWMSLSSSAVDYLALVQSELESAAGIAAPRPSPEEIHGPQFDDD